MLCLSKQVVAQKVRQMNTKRYIFTYLMQGQTHTTVIEVHNFSMNKVKNKQLEVVQTAWRQAVESKIVAPIFVSGKSATIRQVIKTE